MSEEASSAEKVKDREEVEEKAKLHHKEKEEILGKSIKSVPQEGILSMMQEPDKVSEISSDISVIDGLKTQGLKMGLLPKTKEKVIMTGNESKKKKLVAVQDEYTEQKSQVEEFSIQIRSIELKDIKKEHKEASQSSDTKFESPESVCVKGVPDQKQVIGPQYVTFKADSEEKEDIFTQGLKDKSKLLVRKPELHSMTDSKPLEKAGIHYRLKQADQEENPLEAENIEMSLKIQATDSSELVQLREMVSSTPRRIESEEAEEQLYATENIRSKTEITGEPKTAKQTVTQEIDSQSKQSVLVQTEDKPLENVSLEEDISERFTRTDEHSSEGVGLTEKLQKPKEVYKMKMQPSKQKEQIVENMDEFHSFQLRAVTVKDQNMKHEDKLPIVAKTEKQKMIKQDRTQSRTSVVDLTEATSEELLTEKIQKLAKPEEAPVESVQSNLAKVKDEYSKVTLIEENKPGLRKTQNKILVTEELSTKERCLMTASQSESPKEPQQKLTEPKQMIIEQDQQNVSAVKDKTFIITPLKEKKTTQQQIERKDSLTSVMEETLELEVPPEKHAEVKDTECTAVDKVIDGLEDILQKKTISLKKRRQKLAKTREVAGKQIPPKCVTFEDKTENVTQIKGDTHEKIEFAVVDEEILVTDSIPSNNSISEKERQQMLVKTQEAEDEQKDGTPKTQEQQIKRKVSLAPEVEHSVTYAESLEGDTQEKLCRTQKTGNEGIPKCQTCLSKEETSEIKRLQKVPKTGNEIDKKFQSVVVSFKHKKGQTPLTEERKTKQDKEQLIRVYAVKEMGSEEPVKYDILEAVCHEKDEAQKDKTPKSANPKKITVEEVQARTVAVTDEYSSVTSFKPVEPEEVERITSGVPQWTRQLMEEATEKQMSDNLVKDITFRKEKDITDKDIRSDLVPVKSKIDKVAHIEKKTLKRQESIDSMASEETETEVTYAQYLVEYDSPKKCAGAFIDKETEKGDMNQFESIPQKKEISPTPREKKSAMIIDEFQSIGDTKKDKTVKFVPLQEKKMRQEQTETKAKITPEMEVKEKKTDDIPQQKGLAQKLVEIHKITVKDETGQIALRKSGLREQFERKASVTAQQEKPYEDGMAGEIHSKTVSVKNEYGSVTPFEILGKKQELVERRILEAPLMGVASEKSQIVKDGETISEHTFKHTTVKQVKTKDNKDKPEKTEAKREVSVGTEPDIAEQTLVEKLTVMDMMTTVSAIQEMKSRQKLPQRKTTVSPVMVTKGSNSQTENIQSLGRNTKIPLEEVQSKTVVIQHEYGCVTPFKVTETKQEQVEKKSSVATVMELASERIQMVKDGDGKSGTLKQYTTPDELVKDITSVKKDIYEMDDVSSKTMESSHKDIIIEQVKSKVHTAKDNTEKVMPIREKLLERYKQIERTASVTSKPEVKCQHSSEEQGATEKLTVEEIKHSQKQTEKKTAVTPVTGLTDIEIKNIQSKETKFVKAKGQRLDKGTKMYDEVQSKTVAVKNEYGSITPFEVTETKHEQAERTISVAPVMEVASEKHLIVKDGDFKSDTLQRFIIPDKLVKHIASKKEDVYESSEGLSIKHLQNLKSSKESIEILAEKPDITDEDINLKEVTSKFTTDKMAFVGDTIPTKQTQTQQMAKMTAVIHQKEKGEDTTASAVVSSDGISLEKEESTIDNRQTLDQTKEIKLQESMSNVEIFGDKTTKGTPLEKYTTTAESTAEELLQGQDTLEKYTRIVEVDRDNQIEIPKQTLDESNKFQITVEEIQPKMVTATVNPIQGTKMKLEHTENKAAVMPTIEVTSKADGRPEKYVLRTDRITTKQEIRTNMSDKFEIKDKDEWPKSVTIEDEAAKVSSIEGMKGQKQIERQSTVACLLGTKVSLVEQDALERQLKLPKPKEIKTETVIGEGKIVKDFHDKEKSDIKTIEQEQIKVEPLVTLMKRSKEMYQSQDISKNNIPMTTESLDDINVIPWHKPRVREPSVTDTKKPNMAEKKTVHYKIDAPESGESATEKWESGVEQSCPEAPVQYMPPQEVETITRKEGEVEGPQSFIETRVLSLEPEGKENASLQESFRGI
ncbi:titin-like [Trachinotus anak]|uniref:titin-like n=1 Tax=Trachinotus anak TaxID=443729 RepID=UPI0039F2129F